MSPADTFPQNIRALMRTLEQARAYISELEQTIYNISASGIHSCSDQCQRPICVMRRERDAARKDRDRLLDVLSELNTALVARMITSRPSAKRRADLLKAHDKANELIKEMRGKNNDTAV